jgi:hypothetical protein
LLGVPAVWPAGAGVGVCTGFNGCCGAGLADFFIGLTLPGMVFTGHCGPIIGLKFGDTVSSFLCCCV